VADIWFTDGSGFTVSIGGEAGDEFWSIPSFAHNTLLGLLSLLLAFRTSQAYERWWEARKLWGQVRIPEGAPHAAQAIAFESHLQSL
jgi:hypothetical protein